MKRSLVDIKKVILDQNKYTSFYRVISIFKDIVKCVDITDGTIRQKTSDGFATMDIDLSSLIGDLSIPLIDVQQKLELLKAFQNQEVTIETTDKLVTFRDRYTSFDFRKPSPNYIPRENKFIPADELHNIINLADEDLIFVTGIPKIVSDRIKVTSKVFNTAAIIVELNNETCDILMSDESKVQSASLLTNVAMEGKVSGETGMSVTPFILDHDNDLILKMYGVNEKQVLSQIKSIVDDININVYHRSILTLK